MQTLKLYKVSPFFNVRVQSIGLQKVMLRLWHFMRLFNVCWRGDAWRCLIAMKFFARQAGKSVNDVESSKFFKRNRSKSWNCRLLISTWPPARPWSHLGSGDKIDADGDSNQMCQWSFQTDKNSTSCPNRGTRKINKHRNDDNKRSSVIDERLSSRSAVHQFLINQGHWSLFRYRCWNRWFVTSKSATATCWQRRGNQKNMCL